jgi:Cdc6-like AAA superfamily ATPase
MAHKRIIQGFIEAVRNDCKVPISLLEVVNTMKLLENLKAKIQELKPTKRIVFDKRSSDN